MIEIFLISIMDKKNKKYEEIVKAKEIDSVILKKLKKQKELLK